MAKTVADMVRVYERGRYAFSDFFGLSELSDALNDIKSFGSIPFEVWGGAENAERVVMRIGDPESLGYDEAYPISFIRISPKSQKFADDLSHRDFLGALVNLGIDRSVLGDIYISENVGYVICLSRMSKFIAENLTRIKHTSVLCEEVDELPQVSISDPKDIFLRASSLRLDLVISKVYNLSRNISAHLFECRKVFVNGRLCESASYELKIGDVVSVRGYGRFELSNVGEANKKGKPGLNLKVW